MQSEKLWTRVAATASDLPSLELFVASLSGVTEAPETTVVMANIRDDREKQRRRWKQVGKHSRPADGQYVSIQG